MKKILIFTNSYHPVLGGVQTVCGQLAEGLNTNNHVEIITNRFPRKLPKSEIIKGVKVRRLFLGDAYIKVNSLKNLVLKLFSLLFYIYNLFILYKKFRAFQPDVVNIHFPLHQIRYILVLKRFFKFTLITSFHGHDVLRWQTVPEPIRSKLYKHQKKIIQVSKRVSACSKYLAKSIEEIYKLQSNSVKVVYNGVNVNLNAKNLMITDSSYIFAFGRLEYHKGFDLLIEAFSKLKNKKIKLLIAGNGTFKKELEQIISSLNLESRVQLIGRINKNEVENYAAFATLNVVPSRREPFGIVVLEAIASAKPVIACNVGGIPEILDERFGVLVEPSVEGIRKGIEKISTSFIAPSKKLVNEYVEQFSIGKMVENYNDLWR